VCHGASERLHPDRGRIGRLARAQGVDDALFEHLRNAELLRAEVADGHVDDLLAFLRERSHFAGDAENRRSAQARGETRDTLCHTAETASGASAGEVPVNREAASAGFAGLAVVTCTGVNAAEVAPQLQVTTARA